MNVIVQLTKYIFLLLFFLYAVKDYTYLVHKNPEAKQRILRSQIRELFYIAVLGYLIIFAYSRDLMILVLMAGILIYFAVTLICYRLIYPRCSLLLVNNMLMLLAVGFIIIARLNVGQALKQFLIAAAATIAAFLIPVIIHGAYDFIATSENEILICLFFVYIVLLDITAIRSLRRYSKNDVRMY